MDSNKIKNIIALNKDDRYYYSIKEFVKLEAIWVVSSDDNMLTIIDEDYNEVLLIWPHKEAADSRIIKEMKIDGIYIDYIEYETFKSLCIPDMISDNVLFGVFYDVKGEGVLISGKDLLKDLIEEEKNR